MTDGSFLSRTWPSIVALAGTVIVVIGLLFLFGDDGSGGDEAAADDAAGTGEENPDGVAATSNPEAQQTGDATNSGDGANSGDGDTSGEPAGGGDGEQAEEPDEGPATPVEAPAELRTDVGILNSTSVAGLAAGAQERFIEGGWEVPATGNSSAEYEGTTAYYPTEDLRESAEALQAQFPEIRFVEPTPASSNLTRERIVVILAEDYAEAVGETG